MKRKLWSMLLVLALCISCMVPTVQAASKSYLALGDSISMGYGIENPDDIFVNMIAKENGLEVVNVAENGITAPKILAQFENNDWDDMIRDAHLITITCGGNDMIRLLYEKISEKTDIPADEITQTVKDGNILVKLQVLLAAQEVLEGDPDNGVPAFSDSADFAAKLVEFETNLQKVMSYIRALNPEAIVIMTTQYNPYKSFEGSSYDIVYQEMERCAYKLSQAILADAESFGYLVADVRPLFKEDSRNLCNATADPLELDFHPNAAGHAVIAECVQEVYDSVAKEEPAPEEPTPEPPVTEECACADFTDINREAWYHEAVDYALENGIMNGIGNNKFDPEGVTTRAQIVRILWNLENQPEPQSQNVFTDVAAGTWYEKAILWGYENGIVTGYDGKFNPDDEVTREQVAAFLYRYAQYKGYDVSKGSVADLEGFHDADEISEWAMKNIQWAIAEGIMNGDGQGGLDPQGTAKRCEVTQMMYNYLK